MPNLEKEIELTSIELRLAELERLLVDKSKSQHNKAQLLDGNSNLSVNDPSILAQLHYAQEEIERFYLDREHIRNDFVKHVELSNKKIVSLERENQLLLSQLHSLQEELYKNFEIKNNDSTEKLRYGAAERAKKELPYVIGSTVIKNSKSLTGMAKLPLDLAKKIRDYDIQELPDIDSYIDAYEAKHIKKHLSYRIGKEIVDSIESPAKIVSLPSRLSKEILNFHSKKGTKKDC